MPLNKIMLFDNSTLNVRVECRLSKNDLFELFFLLTFLTLLEIVFWPDKQGAFGKYFGSKKCAKFFRVFRQPSTPTAKF
ncbi:MAG: hypothetical protein D3923_17985 [Candidatus Electrothrix sp. AR3]|nr:hypothetical protein [Candidatus Electrothrix sp. AR3]